jgi:AcrR family transcriptional regulator
VAQRTYRGRSAEERRGDRRARLIAAGLELFGTRGWEHTTIRDICAAAELTERYLYESFASREDLLVAVFDELVDESARAVLSAVAVAPHDALSRARAALHAFVVYLTEDPRRVRVMVKEGLGNEALERRRRDAIQQFAVLIERAAQEFFEQRAPSRADMALTSRALVGATAELLLAWLSGEIEATPDRIVEHCAALFVAVADVSSEPARSGSRRRRGLDRR